MSPKPTGTLRAVNSSPVELPLGASVIEVQKPEPEPTLYERMVADTITAENYKDLPPLRWYIPGWVIAGGTTALYGEPGTGKSFWALGLALEAARGGQWHQHQFSEPQRVLYLAQEGVQSHVERARGWVQLHGTELPATLRMVPTQLDIYTDETVGALTRYIEDHGPFDLVIVDTLASASPSAEENDAKDMKTVVSNLERLRRLLPPSAALMIVHHTGKDTAKGLRGHSALFGYVTGTMLITKENNVHRIEAKKVRDGDTPLPLYYRVEPVQLPPLPGSDLAREVGIMVPVGYLDAVKDNVSQLYTALAEAYRPNDLFGRADAEQLSGQTRGPITKALKKGADMGLWEKVGNSRVTRYRFIGRPGDQSALESDPNVIEL